MREEKNLQVKQDDVQINANPAKSRKEIVKERLSVKYPDDNLDKIGRASCRERV